ncbi:MAG: hypothetical protein HY863_15805 [Chloroflexi bacterium]|nr:hypothetical protein [Chloroflexota bacterium]
MTIIRTKDYLVRTRSRTVRERIKTLSGQMYRHGMLETPFKDEGMIGEPVKAEINHGQWLAFCECGGAESVDYDEPIFYCFHCGNQSTNGRPRPVEFPAAEIREEIERLLLERPVDETMGTNAIDRAFNAKPLAIGLVNGEFAALHRSWKPNESANDLYIQNLTVNKSDDGGVL